MVELSPYGTRVVDRINMILMFTACLVCVRNALVCIKQYRRTKGSIHLLNLAQVVVLFIHRLIYGCIPLFEITNCAIFPFLVSMWHLTYLLFYTVMLKRCLILESSQYSRLIKFTGIFLILVRFADWPYELTFHNIQAKMDLPIESGQTCWATWGSGVLILNFIGDTLANLFLSGLFVRRLYKHLQIQTNMIVNQRSALVEYIARKSLVCLTLTFLVNLIMNLLKITSFLGDRSDAFTPFFEIVESTLLVEALRVDHENLKIHQNFCESCGFVIAASDGNGGGRNRRSNNTRRPSSLVRVLSNNTSPTDMDITKPEESFTVTMNSIHHDRSELHARPEWNNNEYRMF